jgi:hypothetical protein
MAVYLRREKKWVSFGTITNSLWIIKLNVYETLEWNFTLREVFHLNFILLYMTWHSWKQRNETINWDWPYAPNSFSESAYINIVVIRAAILQFLHEGYMWIQCTHMLLCLRYKAAIFINKKTFSSASYLIFSQENKWMIIHMIDIFTQNNFKKK